MKETIYIKAFEEACNFSAHKLNIGRKQKINLHNTVKSHHLVHSPANSSQIAELRDKPKWKMNSYICYCNCQVSIMEAPKNPYFMSQKSHISGSS